MAMELTSENLETIGAYVRENLAAWIREFALPRQTEPVLLERIVRVEEELRAGRELMQFGFDQIDKRFEQVDKRFEQVDKRFEQVDKRFEELRVDMNARFDQTDRHMTRWMAAMTLVLGLVGIAVTLAQILA
jgi:hypothetical protein